ncbi:MAG: hypothetical protein Q8R55_01490 [Candidatus Taylorbacteria bacterium]|nr:hypothetical protein [Candidatus Taylorbacteria bacterium]
MGKKTKQVKTVTNKVSTLTPEDRLKRLKNLKPGDKFAYKNTGYGLVSYEDGSDAIGVKKGRLFTDCFEHGMDWNSQTWKFDSGLGSVTTIVLMGDVPKGELK